MSEPSTFTFEELELNLASARAAVQAEQPKFEASAARFTQVTGGLARASSDLARLDREIAVAGRNYAEQYIGASKKPDASTMLLKLKSERELVHVALEYARVELPRARAAALDAEAILVDRQASVKYAEAELSRAHALLAFQNVADAFGEGASVEVQNAEWQKIRAHGDELIHASRSLRRQAEEVLQGVLALQERNF